MNTGVRYEIVIDGTLRTYRDIENLTLEAATYLKTKRPHSVITVRDTESGKTTTVKHPSKRDIRVG